VLLELLGLGKRRSRDPQRHDSISLDCFFEQHYLQFARKNKKTHRADELTYYKHISPALGAYSLSELTTKVLSDWVDGHKELPLRETTVNKHIFLLNRLIGLAVTWGFLEPSRTTGQKVARIATPPPPQRALDVPSVRRLMQCARRDPLPVMQFFIELLVLTGARKGELLNARWRDIDQGDAVLHVGVSKNGRARRIVLSSRATLVLDRLADFSEQIGLEVQPSRYLFPNPDTGRPYRNIDAAWFRIRGAAGLSEVRLHDLRHTYASILVNEGVSIYDIQNLLGHGSVQITQRYAKLDVEKLRSSADIVGAMLG